MTGPAASPRIPGRGIVVQTAASGMPGGEQVAPALDRFATVVPDEAWTELDAC